MSEAKIVDIFSQKNFQRKIPFIYIHANIMP